jgi:hypothetical protein
MKDLETDEGIAIPGFLFRQQIVQGVDVVHKLPKWSKVYSLYIVKAAQHTEAANSPNAGMNLMLCLI